MSDSRSLSHSFEVYSDCLSSFTDEYHFTFFSICFREHLGRYELPCLFRNSHSFYPCSPSLLISIFLYFCKFSHTVIRHYEYEFFFFSYDSYFYYFIFWFEFDSSDSRSCSSHWSYIIFIKLNSFSFFGSDKYIIRSTRSFYPAERVSVFYPNYLETIGSDILNLIHIEFFHYSHLAHKEEVFILFSGNV